MDDYIEERLEERLWLEGLEEIMDEAAMEDDEGAVEL